VALFPLDAKAAVTELRYSAPASATQFVTGLEPGGGYTVSAAAGIMTVTAGGAQLADAAGVLVIAP
jgi:hypothetical protein